MSLIEGSLWLAGAVLGLIVVTWLALMVLLVFEGWVMVRARRRSDQAELARAMAAERRRQREHEARHDRGA